jgi:proteasome lid subunit RPN8/RPN11
MSDLVLPATLARAIEREGSAAYPNECCGILYGRDHAGKRHVDRIEPVINSYEAGEQYHRFSISPQDLMRAEKSAADHGQLVLGFYHSHPDHPARPSETDRQAAWPFYSYIIVSIGKGQPLDTTCWVLDELTETFVRQDIVEAEPQTKETQP